MVPSPITKERKSAYFDHSKRKEKELHQASANMKEKRRQWEGVRRPPRRNLPPLPRRENASFGPWGKGKKRPNSPAQKKETCELGKRKKIPINSREEAGARQGGVFEIGYPNKEKKEHLCCRGRRKKKESLVL